jgi:uncharacterized protein (TIRG00374 family)
MIPAIIGAGVFVLIYTTAFVPQDVERRLARWAEAGGGRRHRIVARLAAAPASLASGVRTALSIVANREWGALGGVVWWGFDIAALWAAFNAFDVAPPLAVIVVAYFVGTLGNTLPLPGGIGGVEGGMIGAFAAFGVDFGLATVSVLTYRAFSFWLPTIPGAVAYLQLRRTVAGWRDQRRADRAAASMIAQP